MYEKRLHITLPTKLATDLRKIARLKGMSRSALIRQFIGYAVVRLHTASKEAAR